VAVADRAGHDRRGEHAGAVVALDQVSGPAPEHLNHGLGVPPGTDGDHRNSHGSHGPQQYRKLGRRLVAPQDDGIREALLPQLAVGRQHA